MTMQIIVQKRKYLHGKILTMKFKVIKILKQEKKNIEGKSLFHSY